MIKLKRVYEAKEAKDGYRVLVDRLWPRGLSKEKAAIDFWLKDIAPSNELRKWFNHDPKKWLEFRKRYRAELKTKSEELRTLKDFEKTRDNVTLLYGAHDELHNQAVVIAELLK